MPLRFITTKLLLVFYASGYFSGCKTNLSDSQQGSELLDSSAIQTMNRNGDNFEITCIDGASQTVSILDFAAKDPREICPGIVYSECGARVVYANGRELKSPNGSYLYANGNVAITKDGAFRYANGQSLVDSNGTMFFPEGSTLHSANKGLMYSNGQILKSANGNLYYPDNSVLASASGALRYPGNRPLIDESGKYYYGDGVNKSLKVGDTFYYRDGSSARSNQMLFRMEDRKTTQVPVVIEEAVSDGINVKGTIRFTIAQNQSSYLLDLPNLYPNMLVRFDSKRNTWLVKYKMINGDSPLQLTFDGKSQSKIVYLKTGYGTEAAVVDFTRSPADCRILSSPAPKPKI